MISSLPKTTKGYFSLVGSALAFSLMSVCVKHLGQRIPVVEIVFFRSVISLVITRFLLRKAQISPWGNKKGLLFIRGILGTAALICVFEAIANLPLASATVLQYSYPTFTAFAAWCFLGEGIKKRIAFAIVIGWAGIVMVVNPDWISTEITQLPPIKVYIALSGALLTALAYTCVRKLSETEHSLVIVHYFPLVSLPITIPFLISQAVLPVNNEWFWIVGIGVFTQLGQLWITHGLSILPAAHASSINYIQVFFAAVWGILIFQEGINQWIVLGSILILFSTIISITGKKESLS